MINYLLLILNALSFTLFFVDKQLAIKKRRRISEKTLLLSSFFGGALGAFFGMYGVRHKTRKLKFVLLIPLFLIFQLVLYAYFYLKLF